MSKNKKMGRMVVPPPQSRGQTRAPMGPPGTVRQEITEMDALKYRLALAKDGNIQNLLKAMEDKRKILAQEEENIRLKISLTRMENQRDIGHLDIQTGDKVTSENGRFFIIRAPRQGTIPFPGKTPEMPLPEIPPQEMHPEGTQPDAEGDGVVQPNEGFGDGAEEPPEQLPTQA